MKLAYKVLLVIGIVSVISIGLLSYIIAVITKSSVSQSIESAQIQLARQTMDKIDRLLNERYNNVQTIIGDSEIESFLANIDQGKTATSGTGNILPGFIKRIQDLTIVTGPWDDFDIISPDGVTRYSLNTQGDAKNINADPVHKKLFTDALNGNIVYSDVIVDNETNKPTVLFVAPVRNGDDPSQKVVGVVIAHLSWPAVTEILGSITGATVDLYNSQGVEISNNDNLALIFKENNSSEPSVKKALQGNEISAVTINSEKLETVSSSVTERGFSAYKGNKWVLLINQPTRSAFVPAAKAARTINLVMVPIFIVTNIIVLLFILRLLHPIEFLTLTIQKIAGGDFSNRVQIDSRDEIGKLGTAFNDMAGKLQELYQNLEKKVKEKTTELSQRMQELEEEKTKDDILLQSIGDGMIASDSSARIVKINNVAKQILDIETDVTDKELFDAFQVYGVDGVAVPRERRPEYVVLESAKVATEIFTINRRDGNKHTINIIATPVIQGEKLIGAIMIIRDVTKEKEVDRMKTEFISLASHQLRTPLSAIKWFVEMLLAGDAGKLSTEQEDFAKNISESTERMIDLVNALLNISRIESGRILIDPRATDLKEMVESIVKELQVKIIKKEQQLIISVHDELPKISVDPRLISQVYLNLLTNAIKYTPKKGEISVFISRKGEDIISQVSDNGYGIPKDQQDKVFQKFFRAQNVAKIETDGTGLGLYLIKAIVESSKGKIWFASEEGKGTSFWFSLPVAGTPAKTGEVTLDE